MKYFKTIAVDEKILTEALSSEISDFEDAVIEASAKKAGAEYILTRNAKDFKKSAIESITPEELLAVI
jgi:predicted nucleic-acid-binding protein